jgi:hypothetical protein
VSDERAESEMSETNNQLPEKEQYFSGDSVPAPWDFTLLMPIPVDYFCCWGPAQFETGPRLVLAPESALRLLPSRALSSAPSGCSVFGASRVAQDGTKKALIIAELSDKSHNGLSPSFPGAYKEEWLRENGREHFGLRQQIPNPTG